jgi:uncharacterized protein DUF6494
MNDEIFNLQLRQFLKKFGITAQREIENHVRAALESGALRGDERLEVRARLTLEGLPPEIEVDGRIALE